MQCCQKQSLTGGAISHFVILCPKIEGDHGIDPDSKTDHDRTDQVLEGKDQGKGRHGILTDLRHK